MFPLMLQNSVVGETGKSSAVFGSWHVPKALTGLGHHTVLKICFSFSGFLLIILMEI